MRDASPHKHDPADLSLDRLLALRMEHAHGSPGEKLGITGFPGRIVIRKRGQGLEFDDLRPYAQGDDVRHIDWNVTARFAAPYVRLFREERERAVTVAVDVRASMFTGSASLRAVTACETAATILWETAALGDRAVAATFGAGASGFSRPAAGDRGALEGCALIAGEFALARARESSTAEEADIAPLLQLAARARRESGLIATVTGLDGFDPEDGNLAKLLGEIGARGNAIFVWVRDPMEAAGLIPGRYTYAGPSGAGTAVLDRRAADMLSAILDEEAEAIRSRFAASGVSLIEAMSGLSDGPAPSRRMIRADIHGRSL